MKNLFLCLIIFLLHLPRLSVAAEEINADVFAGSDDESAVLMIPLLSADDQSVDSNDDPNDGGKNKKSQPAAVGRIVKVVPLDDEYQGSYNFYAGNSLDAGLTIALSKIIVMEVDVGGRWVPRDAFRDRSERGNINFVSQMNADLRANILNGRIQVGVGFNTFNAEELTRSYVTRFKKFGYDLRVNLLQFSDSYSTGNKIFLAISGFKRGSPVTPSLIRLAFAWNLRLGKNSK